MSNHNDVLLKCLIRYVYVCIDTLLFIVIRTYVVVSLAAGVFHNKLLPLTIFFVQVSPYLDQRNILLLAIAIHKSQLYGHKL